MLIQKYTKQNTIKINVSLTEWSVYRCLLQLMLRQFLNNLTANNSLCFFIDKKNCKVQQRCR